MNRNNILLGVFYCDVKAGMMDMESPDMERLTREIRRACKGYLDQVGFALFFGSTSEGYATPISDVDLAIYYLGTPPEAFQFLKVVSGRLDAQYDVKIFQLLPLYVQVEAVKGRLLFGDEALLYEVATATVREYEAFKPKYLDYIRPYTEVSE
ncbi:MAG: nucleotidyltransferase domain-containing protein [Candidatus Heimdallarchaeota archaeon]